MHFIIARGLDLELGQVPGTGPIERIDADHVTLQPADYRGLAARPLVSVGDDVSRGQPVLADRHHPEVVCTSFVSGKVAKIERGHRRTLARVILRVEGDRERQFPQRERHRAEALPAADVRELLLTSGLWTSIRTRPFERIPNPGSTPRALFVTAIDTEPLAPDPAFVLSTRQQDFATGIRALSVLARGETWVCVAAGATIDVPESAHIRRVEFSGPHPAGLPGTHIHAAGLTITHEPDVWHIGYQDVAAFGELLTRGRLAGRRILSLAGTGIDRPRLVSVTPGAEISAFGLTEGAQNQRILAGPVSLGRPAGAFVGRFDRQITVLSTECGSRGARGLQRRIVQRLAGEDAQGARSGGMLPVETFERVWPYRTPPSLLLRALLIGNPEDAARLGCLGLAEDDLALLSLACPAGIDYGTALRRTLDQIEVQEAA